MPHDYDAYAARTIATLCLYAHNRLTGTRSPRGRRYDLLGALADSGADLPWSLRRADFAQVFASMRAHPKFDECMAACDKAFAEELASKDSTYPRTADYFADEALRHFDR